MSATNAHEAMLASGLDDGAVVARNIRSDSARRVMAAVRRFFARPAMLRRRSALVVRRSPPGRSRPHARTAVPDLPTVVVTRGEFVDTLEIRGEIRPLKSIVLSSPMQSGELQILKLAKNGTMVKPGDVRRASSIRRRSQRTIQEKQSELKQADAEIEQAQAQTRIADEQNATALMKASYDIERAKLDVRQGRHGLADRERAGEARARRRGAAAEGARGEDQVRPDAAPRPICRASGASARRRCSI